MSYKQKLTDLLKTIDEIKEDLEELKFWCEFISNLNSTTFTYVFETNNRIHSMWCSFNKAQIRRIIWNPLEERHLRMYCENKGIDDILFETNWFITERNVICTLDNTKSFDNQTEEVYEKIFNFLNKELWQ